MKGFRPQVVIVLKKSRAERLPGWHSKEGERKKKEGRKKKKKKNKKKKNRGKEDEGKKCPEQEQAGQRK